MREYKSEEATVRFWRHVNKGNPSGCWMWIGSAGKHGYGNFNGGGHVWWRAHRFSWVTLRGPIPEGVLVLHECDTPLCVNPDHLKLGTQAKNVEDMWMRGRARPLRGVKHPHYGRTGTAHPMFGVRGTNHPMTFIPPEVKEQVRRLYEADALTQDELAATFSISQTHISRIVRGLV